MTVAKSAEKPVAKPYKKNFVGLAAVDTNALRLRENEEKYAPWLHLQQQLPDRLRGDVGNKK